MSKICTVCGLAADIPSHLPPPDAQGRCMACVQLRTPGTLERVAADQMPACFVPTRETIVRLAVLAMELRGGSRQ